MFVKLEVLTYTYNILFVNKISSIDIRDHIENSKLYKHKQGVNFMVACGILHFYLFTRMIFACIKH